MSFFAKLLFGDNTSPFKLKETFSDGSIVEADLFSQVSPGEKQGLLPVIKKYKEYFLSTYFRLFSTLYEKGELTLEEARDRVIDTAEWHFRSMETLESYRKDEVVAKVEILGAGDADMCATCKKYDGKVVTLSKAPSLPHITCDNLKNPKSRCRCVYLPVI